MKRVWWIMTLLFSPVLLGMVWYTLSASAPQAALEAAAPENIFCNSYYASGLPMTIPDADMQGITSTITIAAPGTFNVTDFELTLSLSHPYPADLVAVLCTPDGCYATLFEHDLTSTGGTYTLHFSDTPPEPVMRIDEVYPPYGDYVYQPVQPMYGTQQRLAGKWRLHMIDEWGADEGTLDSWSIAACNGNLHGTATPTSPPVTPNTPTATVAPAGTPYMVYWVRDDFGSTPTPVPGSGWCTNPTMPRIPWDQLYTVDMREGSSSTVGGQVDVHFCDTDPNYDYLVTFHSETSCTMCGEFYPNNYIYIGDFGHSTDSWTGGEANCLNNPALPRPAFWMVPQLGVLDVTDAEFFGYNFAFSSRTNWTGSGSNPLCKNNTAQFTILASWEYKPRPPTPTPTITPTRFCQTPVPNSAWWWLW